MYKMRLLRLLCVVMAKVLALEWHSTKRVRIKDVKDEMPIIGKTT